MPQPDAFLLDTSAFLALVEREPGRDRVRDLIERAIRGEVLLHACFVSLTEVRYIVIYKRGPATADETIAELKALPVRWVHSDDALCAVRSLCSVISLGTHRTLCAGRTLCSDLSLDALSACRSVISLGTDRTLCSVRPLCSLRTSNALRTLRTCLVSGRRDRDRVSDLRHLNGCSPEQGDVAVHRTVVGRD